MVVPAPVAGADLSAGAVTCSTHLWGPTIITDTAGRRNVRRFALVILTALALAVGTGAANPTPASAAVNIEGAINWASGFSGQGDEYQEKCLQFVRDAYASVGASIGGPTGATVSAVQWWQAHAGQQHPSDLNPPRGALVFWGATTANPDGHVGISLGGGQVISSYSYPKTTPDTYAVHTFSIASRNAGGYPYLGWTWPLAAQFAGAIVQYAQPPQNPSWIVGTDLNRRYIPDGRTYTCLRAHSGDFGVLPPDNLNLMPDLTNIWAGCPPGDVGRSGGGHPDGRVDLFDLSILLSKYGRSDLGALQADDNYDGTVNIFDLSVLLSHYGQTS